MPGKDEKVKTKNLVTLSFIGKHSNVLVGIEPIVRFETRVPEFEAICIYCTHYTVHFRSNGGGGVASQILEL